MGAKVQKIYIFERDEKTIEETARSFLTLQRGCFLFYVLAIFVLFFAQAGALPANEFF